MSSPSLADATPRLDKTWQSRHYIELLVTLALRRKSREFWLAESIGQSFSRQSNNFDLLRLAGALVVLFSHCFALTGQANAEPVAVLLDGAADGGRLAVGMFFVVSGFLVTRSVRAHRPGAYLRGRFLRLWPALAGVLVVQTLLMGPLVTALPARAYFADSGTWLALGRGLLFNPQLGLPGVFAQNPFPSAVNGSLWTLRIEAACYVLLLALARVGALRGRGVACLAIVALGMEAMIQAGPSANPGLPQMLSDYRVVAILDCGVHFIMGMAFWTYRDAIPRSAALAAACLLALSLAAHTALAPVVFHIAFPYLVICVGLGPPLGASLMRRLGDVSYGTYLYAFPLQQLIVGWSGGRIGPWALALAASLPAVLLGVISRHLLEEPALRLKQRLTDRGPTASAGPNSPVLMRASRRPG